MTTSSRPTLRRTSETMVTVPITTDLAGYTAFWQRWLVVLAVVHSLGFVTIIALLFMILRRLDAACGHIP